MISNIESKYPWSFIGVILAIVLTGITLYWTELRDTYEFSYTIEGETDLLEVREEIANLSITYNNKDLLASNQSIKIIYLTIKNEGLTILQSHYDEKTPFGVVFQNSEVLNYKIDATNDDYLQDSFKITPVEYNGPELKGILQFTKLIFDKGSYIKLKVYLLQPSVIGKTSLVPMGKIANISAIEVKNVNVEEENRKTNHILNGFIMIIVIFTSTFAIMILVRFSAMKQLEVNLAKHGIVVNNRER